MDILEKVAYYLGSKYGLVPQWSVVLLTVSPALLLGMGWEAGALTALAYSAGLIQSRMIWGILPIAIVFMRYPKGGIALALLYAWFVVNVWWLSCMLNGHAWFLGNYTCELGVYG